MPENQHSQQVSVLLGTPPAWLVRWGSGLVFAIVLAIIVGAAIVQYPEIITGQMVITASNPVSPVHARKSGRVTEIFAHPGDTVHPGEWIMVIENPASTDHVRTLLDQLHHFDSLVYNRKDSLPYMANVNLLLGELQQPVTNWRLAYSTWANFVNVNIYPRKLEAMRKQLAMYYQYYERSWSQRIVAQEQHDLAESRYLADSILAEKGVIAPLELKQRKEEFLNRSYALHGARSALAQLQIQMHDLERTIAETEAEFENMREQNLQNYYTATAQVRAALAQWIEMHVLLTSVTGTVQYQRAIGVNLAVAANAHLLSIEPLENAAPEVMVAVPPARASRIAVGQRVQGKLDAYPFQEFGMIIGEVSKVNTAPAFDAEGNITYWVSVRLPDEPHTAFGTSIASHRELYGIGEIITDELSLLDRLLFELRRIWGR